VIPWLLRWLTEIMKLAEFAWLAAKLAVVIIAAPGSLSAVVQVKSVAP
jgi:hypothetical protein